MMNLIKKAFYNSAFADIYKEEIKEANRQHIRSLQKSIRLEIARQKCDTLSMSSDASGVTKYEYDRELVVSLTTYGDRIHTVHQTIESIFQQTCQANRVVLWLATEEFCNQPLPELLKRQIKRGLEIRFVKDIRSYKKLIPALAEFPQANIITVDDDIIYPIDMVELLMKAHQRHPAAICAIASRKIELNPDGTFCPYNSFLFENPAKDECSFYYIPEGFGGVLYPPHALHEEVSDEAKFMSLAPTADDLWWKAMELLNKTPVVQIHRYWDLWDWYIINETVQKGGLHNLNLGEHRNDAQLKALFDHYDLYGFLK
ncbi:MAG: hypothetical protein IJR02_05560 [Bacteroidaceae bacterium]|nr:hypothetical protein [Bacteroidaceae bacterium]